MIRTLIRGIHVPLVLLLGLIPAASSCRPPKAPTAEPERQAAAAPSPEELNAFRAEAPSAEPVSAEEGIATWYDVPTESLPDRRAEPGDLIAAHDKLPVGTYARVTHLQNKRSVVVRITDRIGKKGTKIDLCKSAGEAIGLVREGKAKVRIEVFGPTSPAPPGTAER